MVNQITVPVHLILSENIEMGEDLLIIYLKENILDIPVSVMNSYPFRRHNNEGIFYQSFEWNHPSHMSILLILKTSPIREHRNKGNI